MNEQLEKLEKTVKDLLKEIEDLKDKPKFEVGKWYKNEAGCLVFARAFTEKKEPLGYGFAWDKTWLKDSNKNWSEKGLRLATESEVKEALIKEAKRRGFKDGVKIKNLLTCSMDDTCSNGFTYIDYNFFTDTLYAAETYNGDPVIYKQGKWAEILPQEEKIKIGGYEVKFHKANQRCQKSGANFCQDGTNIDGHVFTPEFWQAAKLISEHSKAKIMVGCSKQFDVSLETINKILDKLK